MVPLVEKLINGVLERTSADRQMIGQFLAHLVSQHILLKKQYESALGRVLDTVEDLIVDIPKYWLYMGELIGQFKIFLFLPCSCWVAYHVFVTQWGFIFRFCGLVAVQIPESSPVFSY